MTTTTTTTTVILLTTVKAGLMLAIAGTVFLIIALIVRELAAAHNGEVRPTMGERVRVMLRREQIASLSKNVLVAIVPLLLIFVLVVVTEVSDILGS